MTIFRKASYLTVYTNDCCATSVNCRLDFTTYSDITQQRNIDRAQTAAAFKMYTRFLVVCALLILKRISLGYAEVSSGERQTTAGYSSTQAKLQTTEERQTMGELTSSELQTTREVSSTQATSETATEITVSELQTVVGVLLSEPLTATGVSSPEIQTLTYGPSADVDLQTNTDTLSAASKTTNEVSSPVPRTTTEVLSAEPNTTKDVSSLEPQTTTDVPSAEPQTTAEVSSAEHQTTADVQSTEHQTTAVVPSAEHQTTADVPSAEHQTTADVPSAEHQTTADVLSAEPQTTADVPSAEHQTTADVSSAEHQTTAEVLSAEPQTTAEVQSTEHQTTATIPSAQRQTPDEVSSAEHQTTADVLSAEPQTTAEVHSTEHQTTATIPSAQRQTPDEVSSAEPTTTGDIQSTELQTTNEIRSTVDSSTTLPDMMSTSTAIEPSEGFKKVKGRIRITDGFEFTTQLAISTSIEFQDAEDKMKEMLSRLFEDSSIRNRFIRVSILKFSSGSVWVDFLLWITSNSTTPSESVVQEVASAFIETVERLDGNVTGYKIDRISHSFTAYSNFNREPRAVLRIIDGVKWSVTLRDGRQQYTQDLNMTLTQLLTAAYNSTITDAEFLAVRINRFSGSESDGVKVEYTVILTPGAGNGISLVSRAFGQYIDEHGAQLGAYTIDENYSSIISGTDTPLPTAPAQSQGLETWVITVIIVGVVVFVLFVGLFIIMACPMRRKRDLALLANSYQSSISSAHQQQQYYHGNMDKLLMNDITSVRNGGIEHKQRGEFHIEMSSRTGTWNPTYLESPEKDMPEEADNISTYM
ncbi:PREDICTED: cell wall protein AWA1-like isoform X2 [Priapulus caudatus]|uniref:Cell wall protein AWA1-like isoform X2 n=1 Tax=Priapulus caudatus TaxID=37621 RepID=A0ABM1DSV4_PRICU|nr:PREDICTED: cell wall protein AWA1-like isoform X2 [Priapulus caudatus]